MEIYEQYYLRVASGFNKKNFLLTAIILGNPLTGEWIYAQLIDDTDLEELIGVKHTKKMAQFLSEVKVNINSRSKSDPSSPASQLFGNPWLLNLAKTYGDIFMLEEEIHVGAKGTGQAIINAYNYMQEQMEGLSDHCECDHED